MFFENVHLDYVLKEKKEDIIQQKVNSIIELIDLKSVLKDDKSTFRWTKTKFRLKSNCD
jgi:hypothetical protein